MKSTRIFFVSIFIFICAFSISFAQTTIDSSTFGALRARAIGPAAMSGRITAIDAVHNNPSVIYVGAASGGVWKSINGGTTFKPVFDDHSQSIGAIAIDQTNPDIVWVGTGESDTRNSSSVGTGLYKSTDGGQSWKLVGLADSERISTIAIDPKNPQIVYVAVPGHLWNANEERGLFKTTDGGKTWNKILYANADTGCADVAIDPKDSNTLYASMWQFRRRADFFTSGGPGSGMFKSTDAGKTWKKLTQGLPEGDLGRIAIAVAPSQPNFVYANVEAKKTAFYRSEDKGESWKRVSVDFNVQVRPFYFSHVLVDPEDHKRVYKPGYTLSISEDGGESFAAREGFHPDLHAMWINLKNPLHLLLGTDGGVYTSNDRGRHWHMMRNLPVSQFYHVSYDMETPYNVYGGLQDNGSWMGPSQSINGIENKDWKNVGFGDGFHVWADPKDKDILYAEFQGGNIFRHHKSTGEFKEISPYPQEGDPKFRYNWNTPIEISEKNPDVMYVGAQFVFRSTNRGESWEKISPDLTTNDPEKQKQEDSGGLTIDNSTAENHCTIFAISASPLDENLIWAGTDDGNVQITRDGGKTWTNVIANVPSLPKNTWVSSIEASHHDPATAFATFDGHWTGDMKPYVYKTSDYGKTWQPLANDAIKGYAHIVRQDRVNPNLLFVGTEFGLFLSIDGGKQWAHFKESLPPVSVRDLQIHPRDSDLIIGTHGRGIYILDDITPLRNITPEVLETNVAFLPTRPVEVRFPRFSQDFPGSDEFVGSNLAEAAPITYYLKTRHLIGESKVEVYDSDGKLITSMPAGTRKGINRVYWYMRLKPPKVPPSPQLAQGALFGPTVPPGKYSVKLIKGKETFTTDIELSPDRTVPHSEADRTLQYETTMKLYRMQEDLAFLADSVVSARDQARANAGKLNKNDGLAKRLNAFANDLDAMHKRLVATKEGFITGEEQLREKVVWLYLLVSQYGGKPTQSQLTQAANLQKRMDQENEQYQALLKKNLDSLNSDLQKKNLPPIALINREEWNKKQF